MISPIFRDDSSGADKRAAVIERLMEMCPAPYRPMMRPVASIAIQNASDSDVEGLLIDIDRVRALANAGDMQGVALIAKRYGASEEAINTYLPLFQLSA